jgi:rhodanese-related sulfurtransferase
VDEPCGLLGELSKDRQILASRQVGMRGAIATRILLQKGFDVANLGGGYKTFLLLRAARGSR